MQLNLKLCSQKAREQYFEHRQNALFTVYTATHLWVLTGPETARVGPDYIL